MSNQPDLEALSDVHDHARLVSIIMPVYNASATLGLAIRSVLAQTYRHWELWVLDDGSTDDSVAIALSFNDPRIQVVPAQDNRGRAARLNEGIAYSRGRWIARMDADDAMATTRLEKQVDFMLTHPDADIVGSYALAFDSDNALRGYVAAPLPSGYEEVIRSGRCLMHPTILGKAEWFRRFRYDERFLRAEDYELWIRSYPHSRVRLMPEPLLFYRNTGVMPWWKYRQGLDDMRQAFRKHRERIPAGLRRQALAMYHARVWGYPFWTLLSKLNPMLPATAQQQAWFDDEMRKITG